MTISIRELAQAVKEQNLSKDKLEDYHTQLSSLSAEMELNLADIEKEEAMYLNDCEEETRAGADRKWRATEKGQIEITLKRNIKALDKLRSSVKSRLYQSY